MAPMKEFNSRLLLLDKFEKQLLMPYRKSAINYFSIYPLVPGRRHVYCSACALKPKATFGCVVSPPAGLEDI